MREEQTYYEEWKLLHEDGQVFLDQSMDLAELKDAFEHDKNIYEAPFKCVTNLHELKWKELSSEEGRILSSLKNLNLMRPHHLWWNWRHIRERRRLQVRKEYNDAKKMVALAEIGKILPKTNELLVAMAVSLDDLTRIHERFGLYITRCEKALEERGGSCQEEIKSIKKSIQEHCLTQKGEYKKQRESYESLKKESDNHLKKESDNHLKKESDNHLKEGKSPPKNRENEWSVTISWVWEWIIYKMVQCSLILGILRLSFPSSDLPGLVWSLMGRVWRGAFG